MEIIDLRGIKNISFKRIKETEKKRENKLKIVHSLIPQKFSKKCNKYILVNNDKATFNITDNQRHMVRSDLPVPFYEDFVFYFEVEIVVFGENDVLGIGISTKFSYLQGLPGF